MLNLHDIIFVAPPPQPPSISSDHHNQDDGDDDGDDDDNDCNTSNLHKTTFWGLKKWQEELHTDVEDASDDHDGDHSGLMRACKDCGNRAKRECSFRRCRTCCKTRRFDCTTHLRSTWVPAAKRRQKKKLITGGSSSSLSFSTTASCQDESFKKSLPGQVQAPAVFRCIRVTAVKDGDDNKAEVGYVATVNISGHVFKGFLYDLGIDEKNLFPCDYSGRENKESSPPNVDSSNACAASGN